MLCILEKDIKTHTHSAVPSGSEERHNPGPQASSRARTHIALQFKVQTLPQCRFERSLSSVNMSHKMKYSSVYSIKESRVSNIQRFADCTCYCHTLTHSKHLEQSEGGSASHIGAADRSAQKEPLFVRRLTLKR